MLVIAQALDDLLGAPTPAPSDPWGTWTPVEAATVTPRPDDEAIASVKAALLTADGEEARALEAKLRLLTDEGAAVGASVPEGKRSRTTEHDGALTVEIPPATPERRRTRRAFALTIKLWDYLPRLTHTEALDAFEAGGPLWLYAYDRDAIVAMPDDCKRALVEDINVDSPAQAQEVGRDLLRSAGPGTPDLTLEALAT